MLAKVSPYWRADVTSRCRDLLLRITRSSPESSTDAANVDVNTTQSTLPFGWYVCTCQTESPSTTHSVVLPPFGGSFSELLGGFVQL